MTTKTSFVSAETLMVWARVLQTCNNPLGLTEEMLQESLKYAAPKDYQGAEFLGRYLVPRSFLRYDAEEQPRDKNNDTDHVNNLVNNFETVGYRMDAMPPICSFDTNDVSSFKLKAQSGYHRSSALDRIGQECYFFDIYKFESRYWEIVARNQSNHYNNPQLDQTWRDYQKEVVNAVKNKIVSAEQSSIDNFVDLIAADKTAKVRRRIKDSCYNTCQVFSNFRTYNSTGHGENTLNGFVKDNGFAKQGVEGRSDKELIQQGYIVYCAGNGDNKSSWARCIAHATRLNIPAWIIGYSPNRVDDLEEFRKDYIQDFNEMKELFVQFAQNVVGDGQSSYDEESFPVKLAGFMGQYVKPNPNDNGRPTETGLVDMYGNSIKFNPDGECLTLTQP